MITSITRKSALLVLATLTLTVSASAAQLGPWPTSQPYLWVTNPFTPACGNVFQQSDAPNNLVMANYQTGSKNTWWLPYNPLDSNYAERLCIAQLLGNNSTPLTNVHVRVLDQGKTQKHGWAVVLKDNAGRILDFGVRIGGTTLTFGASGKIAPHQWDGTNWVNYVSGDVWSPWYARPRTGADYYVIDFTQNPDGTITSIIEGLNATVGTFLQDTNTTVVAYGPITAVVLNAMTVDSNWVNYKWTEFSVSPQVISPPPLSIAPTNTAEVALWWPSPWTTNVVVQTNADLTTSGWGDVIAAPADDGVNILLTLPIEAGNRFFRLRD
jgi:hypothetical protein